MSNGTFGTIGCLLSRATNCANGLKREFKETIVVNLRTLVMLA